MASPFPGMDPYLEHPAHWSDFHTTFIVYWREALRAVLPPQYSARIEERMYLVESPPLSRKQIRSDIAVERSTFPKPGSGGGATAVASLAPVTLPLAKFDEMRDTYIQILHRPERSLVAVLELLSPSNKESPGLGEYLAKRHALLKQNVHLVELDLLRGGQRLRCEEPLPPGDYYYFVACGDRRPECDVYAWPLPAPLPKIPISLRAPDPDVIVDLAAIFAVAYERGDYAQEIDYAQPPPVAVPDETLKWINDRLQAAGSDLNGR